MSRKIASAAAPSDTDVFSISDAHLARRYRFIREIGAGNWGCVWLCAPKSDDSATAASASKTPERVAVKLVFREKKATTAQRVRSLWNEMKVVRALKDDPHPSIIPFHSFIITPSFAIITMDYLPYLVPVEVPEYKARDWFRSLLSAVAFLHRRGIVHNDIKPANILLSTKKVPVLVDFGFAERYEAGTPKAFLSNLAYGTPEYLSPERARGSTHDTRKSDMWSLGITFFEILIGRTPFEYVEGEKFMTPADLEQYWARTVRGRWVGQWKMSSSAERFLRMLIAPNAEVRYTANEAMKDMYWTDDIDEEISSEDLYIMSSPASMKSPVRVKVAERSTAASRAREISKLATPKRNPQQDVKSPGTARRRVHQHVLPTIQGSPNIQRTAVYKANSPLSVQPQAAVAKMRPPVKRKPVPRFDDENVVPSTPKADKAAKEATRRVLGDATSRTVNVESPKPARVNSPKLEEVRVVDKDKRFGSGSYARVKAFERLKQLERNRFLEEDDFDYDDGPADGNADVSGELPKPSSPIGRQISTTGLSAKVDEKSVMDMRFERLSTADSSFTLLSDHKGTADESLEQENGKPLAGSNLHASTSFRRSGTNDSNLTLFRHGFKQSIEKFSTIGRSGAPKNSRRASEDLQLQLNANRKENWESKTLVREIPKSSLPVIQQALLNEQLAADNEHDRLSIWIRNVEEVVREAKESFASSSVMPLPALPARPIPRPVGRGSRANRKILAVDQIFQSEPTPLAEAEPDVVAEIAAAAVSPSLKSKPSKNFASIARLSPGRARRATCSVGPSLTVKDAATDSVELSPSKRREKARSSGNLAGMIRQIQPFSDLQRELDKEDNDRVPNLATVLDRSVFIAKLSTTPVMDEFPARDSIYSALKGLQENRKISQGPKSSVMSNPLRESCSSPILNSSNGHSEPINERFVLGAESLARLGKGHKNSLSQSLGRRPPPSASKKNSKLFGRSSSSKSGLQISAPIPIEAPANMNATAIANIISADEVNMSMSMSFSMSGSFRDDASKSVNAVRKAFKAIVTGKSVARRQSKVM